ncbi:hypothetical protein SUGI_0348860 [Cryptomeria japonica]|nr:hypothetical protein SUGI_0348860 [Cryptomeria japonica]
MTCTLSFTQLNAMEIMIIFTASCLVTVQDLLLFFFSAIYILIMSKIAFPAITVAASNPPKLVFSLNLRFACDVLLGTVVGLFFSLVYIFGGIVAGQKADVLAAAPHVFFALCTDFLGERDVQFTQAFAAYQSFRPYFLQYA